MNHCDHEHQTYGEIRWFPTGGGGAVNVCNQHYWNERANWRRRNPGKTPPRWSSLKIVSPRWDGLDK